MERIMRLYVLQYFGCLDSCTAQRCIETARISGSISALGAEFLVCIFAARITEHDIEVLYHKSWKPAYFGFKNQSSWSQGTKTVPVSQYKVSPIMKDPPEDL